MKAQKLKWRSPSLGHEVTVDVFGEDGTPIIHFDGYPEYCNNRKRKAILSGIRVQIDNEFNQVFCPQLTKEADILNKDLDPLRRLKSYTLYENFIRDELIPRVKKESGHDYIILSGVEIGAYHALNLMLKHPDHFNKLIAICGPVNIRPFFGDYFSENMYYNNPAEFLPNLNDSEILNKYRNNDIRLISSAIDRYNDQMNILSDNLSMKSVDHIIDVWGAEQDNDDKTWAEMLRKHVP